MLKLLKNFKIKEWLLVLLTFVFVFAQVWLELKMPDYMQEITVLVQTTGSEMSEILKNDGFAEIEVQQLERYLKEHLTELKKMAASIDIFSAFKGE